MVPAALVLERVYRTQNIQRFENSRKRLQSLIFSLGTFTKEDIYNELLKTGDTVFDTEQTLDDYLQQMVYIGLLRTEFGEYTVQ